MNEATACAAHGFYQSHTFDVHSHHVPAHAHRNTHSHSHTYNILPCFESICGSAQSPLHELFVTNERARGLLLWWLSERTQLCQWELRKQHWRLKALILYAFLIFWLPKHIRFLFLSPHKTHTRAHIMLQWMDWAANMNQTRALLQEYTPLHWAETQHSTTLIPDMVLCSPCRRFGRN